MSKQNDGGPAWPVPITSEGMGVVASDFRGMSVRDYFAGQALAGLCGNNCYQWDDDAANGAKWCRLAADALLKELSK